MSNSVFPCMQWKRGVGQLLTRGGGDVKQIAIAVVAPKAKCWVRLASPSWSSYKESCVQLPMALLVGCHQLYGSSYDYHIIDCTHVPRRPCRTLTLRKKKVEGHWYDPPWHELSENLKKFLRTSSGISSLQELLAELVLTTHYRRM